MRKDDVLAGVAAGQAGVVSRAQVLARGLTEDVIRSRVRDGRWGRPHPGVYAMFSGPLPRAAVRWAALLHAGPGAMLSHLSAAEVSGLAATGAGPVHVTVPAERRVGPAAGLVVHRSRRAVERRHPTRVPPQTRIEETVLDLVEASRDLDEVVGWLARACGRRLTTPARLRAALGRRCRLRHRTVVAEVLDDAALGCHSLLEVRYLRDVERRHRLPQAQRQRVRGRRGGRYYDDVHYPLYATTVELDGRAAHPVDERWRDMVRDNAGVAAGEAVLRYGAADVVERACAVAAQVIVVLWRNGWEGIPAGCGPACAVTQLADRGSSPRRFAR